MPDLALMQCPVSVMFLLEFQPIKGIFETKAIIQASGWLE